MLNIVRILIHYKTFWSIFIPEKEKRGKRNRGRDKVIFS